MRNVFNSMVAIMIGSCLGCAVTQAEASKPTPAAEHQKLQLYIGQWKVDGKLTDGGSFQEDETCEWFDGGFAVVCNGSVSSGVKTHSLITYGTTEKAYGYHSIDSVGLVNSERGTVHGNVWTFVSQAGGTHQANSRFVVKPKSANSFLLTISMQGKDGKWKVVEESTYTKK